MNADYPQVAYRKPSKKALAQGDIALAEFHQLRARSSDRPGPGLPDHASDRLPFFGDPTDHLIQLDLPHGATETRVLRIWSGPVMVLHQGCEIQFADDNDSRLIVAPIASRPMWPEGRWDLLRKNSIPGFLYLPAVAREQRPDLALAADWPESVVCLAGATSSSRALIKPRRELSLTAALLPFLHDTMIRFDSVRGFAGIESLSAARGKRMIDVVETSQTISGTAKLVKLYFGENGAESDEHDDEVTLAFWGIRPTKPA